MDDDAQLGRAKRYEPLSGTSEVVSTLHPVVDVFRKVKFHGFFPPVFPSELGKA